ncbi:MAG: ABC transporter permease [Treponema sp.]|nr:ABC transporter permease [Treponema sp.]
MILHSAIIIMTPLLLAATGGLFSELSGKLNIALEGLLLIGAFFTIVAVHYTGNITAGIASAVLVSIALSAIIAYTTLNLRSNVFITGLAANLLAAGMTIVLSQRFFNTRGVFALRGIDILPVINIPFINRIPVIGEALSGHSLFVYASWLLVFIARMVIYKTPFGYRLRACGKNPAALVSFGIKPDTYRWAAFLISGFFCGIGGSFLSLNIGAFVPNMTAGKGWIALVIIFLGGRKPLGLLAAAFIFGLADAFSNYAQGAQFMRFNVPADFILAIPYLLTFAAIVFVSVLSLKKKR